MWEQRNGCASSRRTKPGIYIHSVCSTPYTTTIMYMWQQTADGFCVLVSHQISSQLSETEVNKSSSCCVFRVKAVDSFKMEDYCVLVTASNDGFIKMWKLHLKEARLFGFPQGHMGHISSVFSSLCSFYTFE